MDGKKNDLGKEMVKHCAGLPLAIIVLGGILAKKGSSNEWQIVHENVKSYIKRGKGLQRIDEVLALSYDELPPYLRSCFLYLSHFPEGYVINAERLIQLWVAEGIVSPEKEEGNGEEIIEDVAERYLIELAERCMIQIQEKDMATSKIKTFQMHDLMRDLCLSKAKQENFLLIVDQSNADSSSTIWRARRVSAHVSFWIQRLKSPNTRSLFWFGELLPDEAFSKLMCKTTLNYLDKHEDISTPLALILVVFLMCRFLSNVGGIWKYLFNNFQLLRVLNFEGKTEVLSRCKVRGDIGNLIHLRFLSLRDLFFVSSKLPSSLGNLRCLQTLDLRIKAICDSIRVPNVIWRMEQLRHLYLPEKCKSKKKLKLDTLRNLQTLVNFNTKHCYLKDLLKLTNLRVLEIRWHFNIEDFKEDLDNFPLIGSKCLHSLSISCDTYGINPRHLEQLLLGCACICKLTLKVDLGKLPEYRYFSEDITYIHLSLSHLDEDPMPTIEKLPNLLVLQFGDSAFIGKKMIFSAGGFPKLDSLSLESLSNLEELQVDKGAMPAIRCLEIVNCRNMKMLPDGLRSIGTLQVLAIKSMPKAFKDRLLEGAEDSNKSQLFRSITFRDCDDQV